MELVRHHEWINGSAEHRLSPSAGGRGGQRDKQIFQRQK